VISVQSNLDLRVVLLLIEEREARLRRTNLFVNEGKHARRAVRRWVGRRLVRLGAWVAADPTMRPARAR
jgi:hypothetical protein